VSGQLIDGVEIARRVRTDWKARVERLTAQGVTPGLAVIMVGANPASQVYVRNKVRACGEIGIHSEEYRLPETATTEEVLAKIESLNARPQIHGILVQLPLPPHVEARRLLESIATEKDVDGFGLYNVGGLVSGGTVFPPCTPYGVTCLLEYSGVPIAGQNVVVVGASTIVGKPMALMLLQKEATVAVCHIRTRDLAQFTILADILVVAAGKPNLITAPMVKTGAVVIDVGINRLADGRLVGDVDFEAVREKASRITPVPGGVGPMTVTMLLVNTIQSAELALARARSAGAIEG
jgi:methylenetetrahydrofolate dehydrogenase (NADP+)/methenyltetrahydrofolate cyclohydrolase